MGQGLEAPGLVGYNFDLQLAAAWTIKFAQENPLPPAQESAARLQPARHFELPITAAFRCAVTIPIVVVIVAVTRRECLQKIVEVFLQGGIVILVDQNRRSGMGNHEEACSIMHMRLRYDILHQGRNVSKFDPHLGFNVGRVDPSRCPRSGNSWGGFG